MTPTIAQAILISIAVLAALFLVHRFMPGKAAQAEHWAAGEVAHLAQALPRVIPLLEQEALHELARVETWLTDTAAEDAVIAKANAVKAAKLTAARAHVAALQAKLPAA